MTKFKLNKIDSNACSCGGWCSPLTIPNVVKCNNCHKVYKLVLLSKK